MLLLSAAVTGLLAGIIHVFAGPDHLAAVAPLAAESRGKAWRAGLMWGIGHSGGTWLLACIAIIFRQAIHVEAVSVWSERLVGFVLIGVGLWALKRALSKHVHTHQHTHGGAAHVHIHAHTPGGNSRHAHRHGALGIGTLHGLAGTSHLLGILPALALPQRSDAVAYVIAFGLGSILAMTVFATAMGIMMRGTLAGGRVYRALMIGTSLAAIGVGVFWLHESSAAAVSGRSGANAAGQEASFRIFSGCRAELTAVS